MLLVGMVHLCTRFAPKPHTNLCCTSKIPQRVDFAAVSTEKLSDTAPEQPRRFRVRLWHILFLIIAVIATLALAWWQWTRFQSGSGTFQNLGYALQWPFFGAFFVYAYRKFVEFENQKLASDEELFDATAQPTSSDTAQTITEIDPSFLPQREQLSVEEFNQLQQPQRRRRGEDR
ncbi:hypothetical protein CPELA_02525 [Corynebacterium pelargi]|uniref:Lipoprotein LprD n=1 Tax=Corynebacterium pelargi TaxID=1471400 RepID=A0A410W7A8_9CORY|nr:hypothetical protein CPELA_02525 [Corynebacterium pelargi]